MSILFSPLHVTFCLSLIQAVWITLLVNVECQLLTTGDGTEISNRPHIGQNLLLVACHMSIYVVVNPLAKHVI